MTTINPLNAQPIQDFWEKTNGPYGGHINGFTINSSGWIYAGTSGGGIFRSSNNGDDWISINIGLNATEVRCLITNTSDHIFAGTYGSGIFRSQNNGDSWIQINAGLTEFYVFSLAVDQSGDIFAGTKSGIFRSTDNGNSWALTGGMNYIFALAINDSGHIFAGNYGNIYRSKDHGFTWSSYGIPAFVILGFTINSRGHIFAATYGAGILRSTDNGDSWITCYSPGPGFNSFAINQSGHIFAGAYKSVYRSTDDGVSWDIVLDGFYVKALAINQSGDVFAGTGDEGVLRSTTNGNEWIQINNKLTATDIFSLAINSNGEIFSAVSGEFGWDNSGNGMLFRTSNDGDDWLSAGKPAGWDGSSIPALAISSSGDILAGTADYSMENWSGIVRSTDGGGTWNGLWFNQDSYPVYSLLIDSDGYIYAGTGYDNGVIMSSTDNGNNWLQLNTGSAATFVYALAIDSIGHLFAGMDNGIYRSTNNGNSWVQINSGLTVIDIRSLVIHSSGILFAGTYGEGVFLSTNNGDTWEATGLTSTYIRSLVVNSIGDIFAGTEGSGVFCSTDNGNTWSQTSTGLTSQYVYSLAINADDRLFAGTLQGVFRSAESTVNVEQIIEGPSSFELTQNYPNPFNPSTTIRYSVSTYKFVTLKVYDVLGNEVATLVDGYKPSGSYEVEFEAASLTSGVYFYQLKSGEYTETKKMILMK